MDTSQIITLFQNLAKAKWHVRPESNNLAYSVYDEDGVRVITVSQGTDTVGALNQAQVYAQFPELVRRLFNVQAVEDK